MGIFLHMKLLIKLFFFVYINFVYTQEIYHTGAITYSLSGGRFGDNMLAYYHAKYASIVSGLPLLYCEFPYSDQLVMHEKELNLIDFDSNKFTKKVIFKKGDRLRLEKNKGILYEIPYFPAYRQEHEDPHTNFFYFPVDWNNFVFKIEIQKMAAARNNLNLISIPSNCLTIGIHIRHNSNGYDLPILHEVKTDSCPIRFKYCDVCFPLKHVPLSYYVQQLKRILKLYPDVPVYVFIFTDDYTPSRFIPMFIDAIPDSRVVYDYRHDINAHDKNVLEDFFSMALFDCFIRPESNIGIAASKIADYKTLIIPSHHRWEGNNLIIDRVLIMHNGKTYEVNN